MRLLIRFQMTAFLLISLLTFNSCKETGGDNELANGGAKIAEEKWQKEIDTAITENKYNFSNFLDSIASQAFASMYADKSRVFLKQPNTDLPNFKAKSLKVIKTEIERLLKDKPKDSTTIKTTLGYLNNLVSLKNKKLDNRDNFSNEANFNSTIEDVLKSDVWIKIIGNDNEKLKFVIDQFRNNVKHISPPQKTKKEALNDSSKESKQKMTWSFFGVNTLEWILLALLIVSVIFNILKVRKISELKNKIVKNEIEQKKRATKLENTTTYQPKQRIINNLSQEKVKSIFDSAFIAMLASLNSEYTSACVGNINFEDYKNLMLDELAKKSFVSETEAKSIVDQGINRAKLKITEKIDDCRDRIMAEEIIDNELEYSQFRNAKLEDEENHNLFSRHVANLKNSLAHTIDAKELDRKIETMRETIKQDILKTIQKNSEYYISFFDTDGTVADSKKSKVRKRDSVVKFIIDPDDSIIATYTLLYDDSVMMKSGIQSYQGLLLPICKIDGSVDSNGSTIAQIGDDGTLILSNGYWKVDQKLTVKII